MDLTKTTLSRRAALTRAAQMAGSLFAVSPLSLALSQTTSKPRSADARSNGKIWSAEYWAQKKDISLYIFRKRLGAPKSSEAARPILFLAHGSSVSSWPTFDLTVPGYADYSMMDEFADYGFDVWTMDFEGYGKSLEQVPAIPTSLPA